MSDLRRGILPCFAIGCAVGCSTVARGSGAQPSTASARSQRTCWGRILPTQADSNLPLPSSLSSGKAKQGGVVVRGRPLRQPEAKMTLRPKRPGCPFGETAFPSGFARGRQASRPRRFLTTRLVPEVEGAESGFGGCIAAAGGFQRPHCLPIRWLSGRRRLTPEGHHWNDWLARFVLFEI